MGWVGTSGMKGNYWTEWTLLGWVGTIVSLVTSGLGGTGVH